MNPSQLNVFLKAFPHSRYHSDARLLTWHPHGTLDDALADHVLMALEVDELCEALPFNRYTDLSLLTDIHLRIGHLFEIAGRRRTAGEPVRSAFFGSTAVSFGIARMYESLMEGALIQVRAFRDCDAAAEWLGVPVHMLRPV